MIHGNTWKGDQAGSSAKHKWIRKYYPPPYLCERCNIKSEKLDLANISGNCTRNREDYLYLCKKCHMIQDGWDKNLINENWKTQKRDSIGKFTI